MRGIWCLFVFLGSIKDLSENLYEFLFLFNSILDAVVVGVALGEIACCEGRIMNYIFTQNTIELFRSISEFSKDK